MSNVQWPTGQRLISNIKFHWLLCMCYISIASCVLNLSFPQLFYGLCLVSGLIPGGSALKKQMLDDRRFPKMHLDLQRLLQVVLQPYLPIIRLPLDLGKLELVTLFGF